MSSSIGTITVNLLAQLEGEKPFHIGTLQLPVDADRVDVASKQVEAKIREVFTTPDCADHRLVQHRDGKPPWCRACGQPTTSKLREQHSPSP